MKERPILFSDAMVRAILDGRKTQTRRAMRYQPACIIDPYGMRGPAPNGSLYSVRVRFAAKQQNWPCPYGQPGDRLWVRETWRIVEDGGCPDEGPTDCTIEYRDGTTATFEVPTDDGYWSSSRWRPSIHMPRFASRIMLEVTGVRVERVKDISENDAAAEGVEPLDSRAHEDREITDFDHALCGNCGGLRLYMSMGANGGACFDTDCRKCETHAQRFRWLWDSINAARGFGWDANPWVWVVEFKRIQ